MKLFSNTHLDYMNDERMIFNAVMDWVDEHPNVTLTLEDIGLESNLGVDQVKVYFATAEKLIEYAYDYIHKEFNIEYPDVPVGWSPKAQFIFNYQNVIQFLYDYPEYLYFVYEMHFGNIGKQVLVGVETFPSSEFIGSIEYGCHLGLISDEDATPFLAATTSSILSFAKYIHDKNLILIFIKELIDIEMESIWNRYQQNTN